MSPQTLAVMVGGALILGIALPSVFMRMVAPALLAGSHSVSNYRGEPVSPGLGIVWLVWAGTATVGGVGVLMLTADSMTPLLALAGPLALVAFAAGLIDDAYGTSDAKGFKGHLSAMAKGRLTTGGLKLVSIGFASVAAAFVLGELAPWGQGTTTGDFATLRYVAGSLIAGAAIALTSNFVNLMDLRPGRALKVYTLLAVAGTVSAAMAPALVATGSAPDHAVRLADALAIAAFALGPVVAVWSFDLGERGMLGDAGANPMGAVAGLLIVAGLPFWALVLFAGAVFVLNAASERVSYTRIIESNPVLRRLDGFGRQYDGAHGEIASEPLSHDEASRK